MRIRVIPKPQALAAGALDDGGRFLFIKRKFRDVDTLELPYAIVLQGVNPIPALKEAFLSQLGIDVQVHETMFEGMHNAGTRKIKRWIPALLFKITAKNAHARPAAEVGYEWLSLETARKRKLSRNAEWLFR